MVIRKEIPITVRAVTPVSPIQALAIRLRMLTAVRGADVWIQVATYPAGQKHRPNKNGFMVIIQEPSMEITPPSNTMFAIPAAEVALRHLVREHVI